MIASAPLTPQDVREAAAMVCETVGQRWHGTQLEDACDECAGAIRAMELPSSTDWQPIETAPQDGREVLGWHKGDRDRDRRIVMAWDSRERAWLTSDRHGCHPTHWQPLPAPPETKS